MSLTLRPEQPQDAEAIRQITEAAFAGAEHSSGTEAAIVDALRDAGALSLSLVALDDAGEVIGHVAFSPVRIDGEDHGWLGLGPVSVRPDRQRRGIGAALIREGLERLAAQGAAGCVVLGEPAYYRRFGFENDPGLRLEGPPPDYFLRIVLAGPAAAGRVDYHPGFGAA